MILNDVITEVRRLVQDEESDTALRRYSDAFILSMANQTLKRMAVVRPDLFSYIGDITCTQDAVLQSAPSGSIRIMDVFRIKNGAAVRETNKASLDQMSPGWVTETAAACSCWMRHPKNPNKFFIYPPAPAGQILVGEYAQSPEDYDGTTEVELIPDAFFPAVVDGTIWLIESVDNEHVSSGRAKMFQEMFLQQLGVSMAAKSITDKSESAPMDKEGA